MNDKHTPGRQLLQAASRAEAEALLIAAAAELSPVDVAIAEVRRLRETNAEMLAALQAAEKYLDSATPDGTPIMYATLKQVRAAIAKATGA